MRLLAHTPRRQRAAAGLLCLALGAGLAGCDEFITTEPRGQLVSGNFFATAQHAIEATNATYSHLRNFDVHVFQWIGMTEIASDDANKGSTPTDNADMLILDNLGWDAGHPFLLSTWTGYYRGIYRANLAIENIPGIAMDEALKARLIGENKFLRAYYYFYLVRAFGGVPLITAPLQPGEFMQQRASAEEVYNLIRQDLTDAIVALPATYPAADVGRVTNNAARGLLAKVHLFQGDHQNAFTRAVEVIQAPQTSLFPNFTTLFTRAGENSSETLFEVQAVALQQGGAGSQYSEVQGVRGIPNLGWGFNTPSDELQAAFEPGDPRLQATILYSWEQLPDGSNNVVFYNATVPDNQNRYNQKSFQSPNNPGGNGNGGNNIRRLRYADVLLIAAEAAFHTNRVGEAQGYLNQVRARARGGQNVTLGFSPEQMFEPIATDVLDLGATTSRVFVRYVNPASPAFAAGLRTFNGLCSGANNSCPNQAIPPVRVVHADIIQSVDGTPITNLQSFFNAVNTRTPGASVTLQVLRVTQPSAGTTNTETLTLTVPAQQLLPDVTATGEALLDAIWNERRVELAMEQHRWFDLLRQDRIRPGRAAQMMAAHGKTFQDRHRLYPIPLVEIQISQLQQNPGY